MISPDHLTICVLPIEQKTRIDLLIKNHITWCQNEGNTKLADQWNSVLNYMWSKDNSHYLTEFKRLTNLMDCYRKESMLQVLPELQNLL
jgi:hypothetical protein